MLQKIKIFADSTARIPDNQATKQIILPKQSYSNASIPTALLAALANGI
jgi:hypothetical protein